MRMPVTFPPEVFAGGRLLSGLGVPDISGRIGKPAFYTSDPFYSVREGNDFSIELVRLPSNVGRIETKIAGPPGKPFGLSGWIELPLSLTVSAARDRLTIEAGGQSVSLAAGQWSDWVSLGFRVNPLITVHGYARLRVESVQPEVNLYLSPIQFDPERLPPGFKLSSPAGFARDLVARFGRYKTMGWAIDTWSMQSGTLKEQAFLEDVAATVKQERRMLASLLQSDERLLVHYFEFPDRIGHVFWRLRDPKHPAYDAALAAKYGDAVEKSYETMDAIVGDTARALAKRGRPARAFRPRLCLLAPFRQLQHVARRGGLPRSLRRRQPQEPGGPFREGAVLGVGRLVEDEGLLDGFWRHLRQPERA